MLKSDEAQIALDWNRRFQSILKNVRSASGPDERVQGYSELSSLVTDFIYLAETYAKIIISEGAWRESACVAFVRCATRPASPQRTCPTIAKLCGPRKSAALPAATSAIGAVAGGVVERAAARNADTLCTASCSSLPTTRAASIRATKRRRKVGALAAAPCARSRGAASSRRPRPERAARLLQLRHCAAALSALCHRRLLWFVSFGWGFVSLKRSLTSRFVRLSHVVHVCFAHRQQ